MTDGDVRGPGDDFADFEFQANEICHRVFVYGAGPPVILMHELDGFGPEFIELVKTIGQRYTVYAPLFMKPFGKRVNLARATWCVRREFELFRLGRSGPISDWLRALIGKVAKLSGDNESVGVIGMCLTGGLVLATIAEPSVAAGVAAQPSLPFASSRCSSKTRKKDLGLSDKETKAARESETPLLLLRYGNDRICPAERIHSIRENIPHAIGPPEFLNGCGSHATLTDQFRDKSPAITELSRRALAEVFTFLETHLSSKPAGY